jgi:hypothetical protein
MLKALLIPTILAAGLAAAPTFALDLGGAGGIGGSAGGGIGGSIGGGIGGLRGTAEPLGQRLGTVAPLAETPSSSTVHSDPTSLIGLSIMTSDGTAVGHAFAVQIGDNGEPVTISALIAHGPRRIQVQFPIHLTTLIDGEIRLAASEAQLRSFLASNADAVDATTAAAPSAAVPAPEPGEASSAVEDAVLAAMRQVPLDASTTGQELLQWNEEEALVPAVLEASGNASAPAASVIDENYAEDAPDFVRPDATADVTQLFAGENVGNSDQTRAGAVAERPTASSADVRTVSAPSTPSPAERATDSRETPQAPALTAYPLGSAAGYARLWLWLVLPLTALAIGLASRRGRDWLSRRMATLGSSVRLSSPVPG